MDSGSDNLSQQIQRVTHQLASRRFPEIARALHAAIPGTILRWRMLSLEAMPFLDTLSVAEFENSIATTLHLLANLLERNDPESLHRLLEETPAHGLQRFIQHCGPETLLAEERILRAVVVQEVRSTLGRSPSAEEAAGLHDLLDLMGDHSLMALLNKRGEERDRVVQTRVSGLHRLAHLGTLVAGVAHDAANLFLPLRMRLEHLRKRELTSDAQEDLASIELIIKQFQNSIINLRWLSIDAARESQPASPAHPAASLRIQEWATEAADFYRRLLPPRIHLEFEVSPTLPAAAITSAALSQIVFNLVHNAIQAIATLGSDHVGHILLRADRGENGTIHIAVEDDGPGMSDEVLRRSMEPFFTTRANGSGIGLSLVRALLDGCGGSMRLVSPPPGKVRGTIAVLTLRMAEAM